MQIDTGNRSVFGAELWRVDQRYVTCLVRLVRLCIWVGISMDLLNLTVLVCVPHVAML